MENSEKVNKEGNYECPICKGHGEVDVGWYNSCIIPCGNCEGTGQCDWIRNAIPKHFYSKIGKWK